MSDDFQANEIRGTYDASGMRFGIVVSRFNSFITERLLAGAIDALEKGGASAAQHRRGARARLVRDSAGRQEDGRRRGVATRSSPSGACCAGRRRISITWPRKWRAAFS